MTSRDSYERQLKWRIRQIEIGKDLPAYATYVATIPKHRRSRDNPSTPDPYDARMSKRQFDGRVKAWKSTIRERFDTQCPPEKDSGHAISLFLSREEAQSLKSIPRKYVIVKT